jgi:hypothetical protein
LEESIASMDALHEQDPIGCCVGVPTVFEILPTRSLGFGSNIGFCGSVLVVGKPTHDTR